MALYTGVLDGNGWLTPKDFTNAAVAKLCRNAERWDKTCTSRAAAA